MLFSIENAKFWHPLAHFVANLRSYWCTFTGINNTVVNNIRYVGETERRRKYEIKVKFS